MLLDWDCRSCLRFFLCVSYFYIYKQSNVDMDAWLNVWIEYVMTCWRLSKMYSYFYKYKQSNADVNA